MARRDSRSGRPSSAYNYARLGVLVINRIFDRRGNWTAHEACARAHLGVSNWWLARFHARAIEASQMAVKRIIKSEIVASPNATTLISRIRRPDNCLLSAAQILQSLSSAAVADVVNVTEHGLTGMPSNRKKVTEQIKFSEFVRAHRSPTGRTADKNGRRHGASFYLDAKWKVLRNKRNTEDTQASFSTAFNTALRAAGLPVVHVDIPLRWLRSPFGSTKIVDGRSVPFDEHTTLYSQKTDACTTCEMHTSDLRSTKQILKRHMQQPDQGSLMRREAINDTNMSIEDLKGALRRHKQEAARAIK